MHRHAAPLVIDLYPMRTTTDEARHFGTSSYLMRVPVYIHCVCRFVTCVQIRTRVDYPVCVTCFSDKTLFSMLCSVRVHTLASPFQPSFVHTYTYVSSTSRTLVLHRDLGVNVNNFSIINSTTKTIPLNDTAKRYR